MESDLEVVTVADVDSFLGLEAEWNTLLQRTRADTVFLTWQWQKAWWDCFGEEGRLAVLTARDRGELVALAPFYIAAPNGSLGTLRLIGGVEVSDYLDLIVADNKEGPAYRALWEFLTSECAYPWRGMDLHNVPGLSGTLESLATIAGGTDGVRVTRQVEDVCPVISLPPSWEDYLRLLTKKQRHEIRRKLRKADREATVDWYYVEDEETLTREVEDFIALHQRSAAQKKEFMDQRMQRFFHRVASSAFDQGWLKLAFLVVNEVKAATMFCFDYNDSILVYNSGYDPRMHPSLSTGIVLLSYCIRDAIAKGRRTFDFLRGAEDYKYRFGGEDREVYNLRITR